MRKTKTTSTVLQRLADAAGVRLGRDGKLWLVHTADLLTPSQKKEWREWGFKTEPRPQNSTKALATLALCLFEKYGKADPDKWEALRQEVRYDPGTRRHSWSTRIQLEVAVPTKGLSCNEEVALQRLAITEIE